MSTTPPTADKAALRRAFRDARDAIAPAVRRGAASRIALRVVEQVFPRLPRGAILALYAAKGSEVDPREVASAAVAHGLVLAYPRSSAEHRALTFHRATPDALRPGRFGIDEPPPDAELVDPAAIACAIVPGLAFDRRGTRLGSGHGHYDATIARVPLRIGLAYDSHLVDRLPRGDHDVPVHAVITEVALYRAT